MDQPQTLKRARDSKSGNSLRGKVRRLNAVQKTASNRKPRRTLVRPSDSRHSAGNTSDISSKRVPEAPPPSGNAEIPHDTLIVASKLKLYIRAVSGMNTSDTALNALSDHVRALCDKAIEEARRDERKTVMDRDYPSLKR